MSKTFVAFEWVPLDGGPTKTLELTPEQWDEFYQKACESEKAPDPEPPVQTMTRVKLRVLEPGEKQHKGEVYLDARGGYVPDPRSAPETRRGPRAKKSERQPQDRLFDVDGDT